MTAESSISFFLAVFIFGITPGPGVFAILARALATGARSCLLLALGMVLSDILYLIAACFGLAALATHWDAAFTAVRWLGAAYLLYLGWKMWTAPRRDLAGPTRQGASQVVRSFIQGFLISASNPKVILFYIAFLPTFIDLSVLNAADIALISLLTLLGLMTGLSLIAFFAGRSRLYFESERAALVLTRCAGSIMMAAGAFLLLRT